MQSKFIKFMALIFLAIVLCVTTTVAGHGFDDEASCRCKRESGYETSRFSTRQCCEDSNGSYRRERCFGAFNTKFLNCCRDLGRKGVCHI